MVAIPIVHLGWVIFDLQNSPGWWAATVATYCPSRMVEHPKTKLTKPGCMIGIATLYCVHNFHVSPCLLQFSSMDHFTPGTYFKSEDLCNPEIDSDDGCLGGQCEKLRRGLCALPPFKQPRTLVK